VSYRITALQVTDYKRLRTVAIAPAADRSLVLIGGKNAQGKSSILDALTAAFGGKRSQAADPVRHGEKEAAIFVELDGGKLTIDRTIAPDGSTTLEVRDEEGAVRSPQAVLDKLVGARFLDPLAWLQLSAKDQRAALMKLIPGAERIDGLNEKRVRAFDRRTEIGRDLAKARGELERLPPTTPADRLVELDVAQLNEEARALAEQQRAGDALGVQRDSRVRGTEEAVRARVANAHAIERLESELADLRGKSEAFDAEVRRCEAIAAEAVARVEAAAKAWGAGAARRAQLDADLKRAGDHNRAVASAAAANVRRADVEVATAKLGAEVEDLTKVIATIDLRKAGILEAAKLPVEGLKVVDDGVELGGVPFAQASGAERLRVALALAIAASPGLHDVWIRDGALLDQESLEQVAQHAAAAGKRCWIERVGTADAGVIVIQDGQVVS